MRVTGRKVGEFPHILEQWHPTKNGDLKPHGLAAGTHKVVWWKCPKGPDHEWQATIKERLGGGLGCPFCSSRRLSVTNRLDIVAPYLMAEWDYEKNGDVTPDKITYGSGVAVWWRCPKGPDHLWQAKPAERILNETGCPFCANRSVSVTNSLATCRPDLASQWHPTKNGDLTPADINKGSSRKVWWQCPKDAEHVWRICVYNRVMGMGCPYCAHRRVSKTNSLAALSPDVAAQWHPTKNGDLTPADVTSRSHKRVWWQCPKFPEHEWDTPVSNRRYGHGCPFCAKYPQRVCITNSLATLFPHVAAEWHPTKNGDLRPTDVTSKSGRDVWWKCPKAPDHEWHVQVQSRTGKKGCGCPFCAGCRASTANSLATLFPNMAAQWHPTKNGDLTPAQVTPGSGRRAYWRCEVGHEWSTLINSRTKQRSGCPHCRRRKRKVVTKRKRGEVVYMPSYEGPRATPAPATRSKKR